MKHIPIDWQWLAIEEIEVKYICPICDYSYHNKNRVAEHIRAEHTQEEIKEICTK